jgi:hypothetical protein
MLLQVHKDQQIPHMTLPHLKKVEQEEEKEETLIGIGDVQVEAENEKPEEPEKAEKVEVENKMFKFNKIKNFIQII